MGPERDHPHLPAVGNRLPVTTYRLQLQPRFGFAEAEAALSTLAELGVTDLYLSPILQATTGSTHGYDVVDHSTIDDELGGRDAFESLARAAHELGMYIVVDVVPNHMAIPVPLWENRALWSALRDGSASPYAEFFDGSEIDDQFLLAVLGERIGTAIANDLITLDQTTVPGEDEPSWVLRYREHVFPVRAGSENLPLIPLLQAQFYRLAYWKVADDELNYRRFFDVGSLVAVRVEQKSVFRLTHKLLFDLFHAGHIDGFRIDHPDGLADPRQYFRWLAEATNGSWVAAEKILAHDESLPTDWPVSGTTGYDAAWRIGSLFVDPAGALPLLGLAQSLTGSTASLDDEITAAKRYTTGSSLFTEIHRLAVVTREICNRDILLCDHTFRALLTCINELVISMDRYRAYIIPGETAPLDEVAAVHRAAETAALRLEPDLHDTLDLVVALALGEEVGCLGRQDEALHHELVVRFQQVMGAVTAKGVEDTAFYRWTQLTSLCEVGGSPAAFGTTPDDLHSWCARMAQDWPGTMTLLSSHDTKRSEDVRARINVLSEYPEEWTQLVSVLEPFASNLEGHSRNLLWQTIWGTWDEGIISSERLSRYLVKAAREQKIWTTWTAPDLEGEQALTELCELLVADETVQSEFSEFGSLTSREVRTNVLGQKAIQLTCVGVADVYQGTERLQNYLVDPDNRSPLDVTALRTAMAKKGTSQPSSLSLSEEKLFLVQRILKLRRELPDTFVGMEAHYRALATSTGHVIAFSRGAVPRAVTVASRLTRQVNDRNGFGEHTVVLPDGNWSDIVTCKRFVGGEQLITDVLTTGPVAVLRRID